jgi:CHAT domain-containing protein/Tfp pilus assembly protein PilF
MRFARSTAVALLLSFAAVAQSGEWATATTSAQSANQAPEALAGAGQSVPVSLDEARLLQQEADAHIAARQFKEALDKTERALAARRQHLGESHLDVAYSTSRLGVIAYQQGQYDRAETLFTGALTIREAVLGPQHLEVAESVSDVASMLLLKGDYVRSESLLVRALDIFERAPAGSRTSAPDGDVDTLTGDVYNNLGFLYSRRRDYTRAEAQYLKAVAIRERTRGPNDLKVAETLASLGGMYSTSEQFEKAKATLRRALTIQESSLPANSPSLATTSYNLALVYLGQGDYPNAEPLFRRALSIDEQALDAQHPRIATRLVGLAEVLRLQGDYANADPLYERALAIRERALGPGHPDVATTILQRALLRYAMGDSGGATDLLSEGAVRREESLAMVLTTGSEAQKRLYLQRLADDTDHAISLHLGASRQSPAAARLALTNIVQRKGRSIDAMAEYMATIRRRLDDTDRELLGQLSSAQSRLATTALRGAATDEQRQAMAALRGEIEQLEQAISVRSTEFRVASRKATLEGIQRALPGRTALIEFVSYRPFAVANPRVTAYGAPRYAAYVLRESGDVMGVDIGEAAQIERYVRRFRAALANPLDGGLRQTGRMLYDQLIGPLRASLGETEHLIISPDGALNLFPFAALVGSDNKYVVEHSVISYVTSGRDLLRLEQGERRSSQVLGPPVIVANPSFDDTPATSSPASATQASTRAFDPRTLDQPLRFSPLPGTAQEAAALAAVLPDARVYSGTAASETMIKQLIAPSVLHVATHGFFLRPRQPASRTTPSAPSSAENPAIDREDALVLSGLALAGANRGVSVDTDDGILTALEVAGLDLWGTRMVVLSACETGVGDARNGEGVYGLRRALVLAGSESQMVSLWKVPDAATRDLMIAFYQRLRKGEHRADALRNAQLAMLRGPRSQVHPFYWASFILSGDWRQMFPMS